MEYPFLFFLPKDNHDLGTKNVLQDTWIVKIANFDYVFYDSSWMCDEDLGNSILTPDVDKLITKHIFYSEKEALIFIREWWSNKLRPEEELAELTL